MSEAKSTGAIDPQVAICIALPIVIAALEGLGKPWSTFAAIMLKRASVSLCGTPEVFGEDDAVEWTPDNAADCDALSESIRYQVGGHC